jgi:hypothetical protein
MAFPDADLWGKAFGGQEVGLDARSETGPWAEYREDIEAAWGEMGKMLVV